MHIHVLKLKMYCEPMKIKESAQVFHPLSRAGRSVGGTCLFGRLKIGVFKCGELKNRENHRSNDG